MDEVLKTTVHDPKWIYQSLAFQLVLRFRLVNPNTKTTDERGLGQVQKELLYIVLHQVLHQMQVPSFPSNDKQLVHDLHHVFEELPTLSNQKEELIE